MRKYLFFFTLDMGFNEEEARQIGVAFNEALRNIIQYAYHKSIYSIITVEFRHFKNYIELYIKDSGTKVVRSKILAHPLDEYRNSGLGLHLMETFVDYLNYDTSDEYSTVLTMVRYLTNKENLNRNILFKKTPP